VAPSRLSKPGYKILGGLVLAAAAWLGVPRLVGGLEFFRVRKIEVRGLVNARAEDLVPKLPLVAGASIFADLTPVRRAAESLPGIERAGLSRRLPGTIILTVRETPAVALVMRRGRLQLVSARGLALEFDPTVAAPDLPIVEAADSLVAGFLARMRTTDPGFFSRIVTGRRVGNDVVVTVESRRYWFRPDAGAEVMRAVAAVEQDLENKGRRWAELDARFAGQVVIRWEAA
jgi:hypothetical protein